MADETGSDQAETWGTRDAEVVDAAPSRRSGVWVWWVSILLLLATMLNYMDRQALSVLSKRITTELQISNERYGDLEFGFGTAFAAGSLVFGILADRFSNGGLRSFLVEAFTAAPQREVGTGMKSGPVGSP